ncbi:MAG: M48 family metallopeptidase [Methylophilales bacterium]|jgi:STE24 endopeptidase|nr:M48 family metallopeptidase [Pseudomonadota bacterium]NQW34642.1 M48 family metallopeptidase [Methylophilales bacterium]|tara:strand:- start:1069 stop:2310 length:1242 start_codon:yes stop_codon:yes gene_type:complete
MTSSFQYLFLFLIIFTVFTQVWLAMRHITNVKLHRSKVPSAFKSIIKSKDHQKAADYTVAKSKLNIIDIIIQAVFLYILTVGGLINTINNHVYTLELNNLISGAAIIISVMILSSLIDLPVSVYKIFNIDEKFGFNRMTIKIFILDGLKQLILSVAIGLPILFISLWIIGNLGSLWWLWLWVFVSLFNFAMLSLYPLYIAPLFNKFEPLKDKTLKSRIEKLLVRCGFKSSGLFVMNGSLRSNHGNAYFTGFGKSKRIVFFDTLLEKLTPNEIDAVLAHELGHFHHDHVKKRIILMFIISFVGLYLLGLLKESAWFYEGLGVYTINDANAILLFLLVSPLFIFFIRPVIAYYSRKNEFEADQYACKYTAPSDLKQSLIKLYRDNASTLTPDPLHSNFYDSHPPALMRINAIDKL